jgi:hypothetical protein
MAGEAARRPAQARCSRAQQSQRCEKSGAQGLRPLLPGALERALPDLRPRFGRERGTVETDLPARAHHVSPCEKIVEQRLYAHRIIT